jgi:hypothetical protein
MGRPGQVIASLSTPSQAAAILARPAGVIYRYSPPGWPFQSVTDESLTRAWPCTARRQGIVRRIQFLRYVPGCDSRDLNEWIYGHEDSVVTAGSGDDIVRLAVQVCRGGTFLRALPLTSLVQLVRLLLHKN